jgi:hypothetical protein
MPRGAGVVLLEQRQRHFEAVGADELFDNVHELSEEKLIAGGPVASSVEGVATRSRK